MTTPAKLTVWATGNYPAGILPWSGTTVVTQPAYNFFTPGMAFAAQEENWLLNLLTNAYNTGLDAALSAPLVWKPRIGLPVVSITQNIGGIVWDQYRARWLAVGYEANNDSYPCIQSADGASWFGLGVLRGGSFIGSPRSICVRPSDGAILVTDNINFGVSTDNNHFDFVSPGFLAGADKYGLYVLNSIFYSYSYQAVGGGLFTGVEGSSPDGVTWTNRSAGLPAQMVGGTNTGQQIWTAVSTPANPATALALVGLNGAQYSRMMLQSAATPTVFTDVTPALMSAGYKLIGMCYSSTDNLFMIAFYNGSQTYVMSSPDGSTWTQIASMSNAHTPGGLACSGSAYVLTFSTGAMNPSFPECYVSTNKGITWGLCPTFTGSWTGTTRGLVGGPSQFIWWYDVYLHASGIQSAPIPTYSL